MARDYFRIRRTTVRRIAEEIGPCPSCPWLAPRRRRTGATVLDVVHGLAEATHVLNGTQISGPAPCRSIYFRQCLAFGKDSAGGRNGTERAVRLRRANRAPQFHQCLAPPSRSITGRGVPGGVH